MWFYLKKMIKDGVEKKMNHVKYYTEKITFIYIMYSRLLCILDVNGTDESKSKEIRMQYRPQNGLKIS